MSVISCKDREGKSHNLNPHNIVDLYLSDKPDQEDLPAGQELIEVVLVGRHKITIVANMPTIIRNINNQLTR